MVSYLELALPLLLVRCTCSSAKKVVSNSLPSIDKLLEELLPKLQEKLSEVVAEAVRVALANLCLEIDQLKTQNDTLTSRVAELERQQSQERPYGAPPGQLFKGPEFQGAIARAIEDQAEREKKRSNLVIVGLPEPRPGLSDQPTPTDFEAVSQLAADLAIPPGKVERVFRHGQEVQGRVRITKIVFNCLDARRRFLAGLRPMLQQRHGLAPNAKMPFWVRPDLTRDELAAQADQRRQIQERRSNGGDPVVFRGQIMERAERDRIRSQGK